jgi:hypothetical protein
MLQLQHGILPPTMEVLQMKAIPALVLLVFSLAPGARGAGPDYRIDISASKKTGDRYRSSKQDLPKGSTHLEQTSVYYRFDIKCMTPKLDKSVQAEWFIAVEGAGGKVRPGAHGATTVDLVFGKTQSFDTDPVKLTEREVHIRDRGKGSFEEKVYGYAVRLVDESGVILAEDFRPATLYNQLNWEQAKRDPVRDRRPPLPPKARDFLKKALEGRPPPRR